MICETNMLIKVLSSEWGTHEKRREKQPKNEMSNLFIYDKLAAKKKELPKSEHIEMEKENIYYCANTFAICNVHKVACEFLR